MTSRQARGAFGSEQKLVIVGSGGVGKSAITIRFCTSQFYDQAYNPTIEDSYRKQFVVDDEAVTLEILDTAGQEEYGAMADQWYRHGTGFLLVYSITDRPTFEALAGLHQNILRVKDREGGNVPCVVVSNKCDLARLRQVGQLEGRDLAKSLGAPFIECSAADGVNVEIAFRELVKLVRKDERRLNAAARTILAGPLSGPPLPLGSGSSPEPGSRRRPAPIQTIDGPNPSPSRKGGSKRSRNKANKAGTESWCVLM